MSAAHISAARARVVYRPDGSISVVVDGNPGSPLVKIRTIRIPHAPHR